jgi:hypothetical protein
VTRRPVADVRAAVTEWLAGSLERDPFMLWTARHDINTMLHDGTYDPLDFTTETQVARVLDEVVKTGALVKLRRGGTGPDGKTYRNRQPRFYTPAAWEAAVAEADRDARQAEAIREKWERIWDELDRRGLTPGMTKRGQPVRLSYAAWFRLLGLDED